MIAVVAVLLGIGSALLLSLVPAFGRERLAERLAPYGPGRRPGATDEAAGWRSMLRPALTAGGTRLATWFGVTEGLQLRLDRVHDERDPGTFRAQQAGLAAGGLGFGAVLCIALQPPVPLATALLIAGATGGFLLAEHRLAARSTSWQQRLMLELPVIAEQLGLLLASGWSLGAGLARIAERGNGCTARDLRRVITRIRQGLSETDALLEWAAVAQVDAVNHLVAVLSLHHQTSDLGALVADEARSMRRDAHRRLIEDLERRAQAVWIPVTVATLVPGVIFLAVPFVAVMRTLSG
jgi:pilus assembly protein TadC